MNEKMQLQELFKDVITVKKNCLYISSRENKAITRQKELYPVAAYNNVYFDIVDMGVGGQKIFNTYIDYGFITYDLHISFYEYNTLEEVTNRLKNISFTYDWIKDIIIGYSQNKQFVNVAEIKLFELAGESQELVNQLVNARQEYLNLKQLEQEKKNNARLEAATKQYNELMQEYNDTLVKAEQSIINKIKVNNIEIALPELDGAYVYKNNKSLVLELFKKYNINIPLKTQGWINKALAEIKHLESGEITYSYYSSSKNSTVFMKYLQELEIAIQKAYNKVDTEAEARLQDKKEKENRNNSIPALQWKEIDQHSFRQRMENNTFIKQNEVIELDNDKLQEVAKIAYKALNSKNIDAAVDNWNTLNIFDTEYKGRYYFRLNGNTVEVYPRLVKGEIKILYIKNTKKEYMCIA